MQIFENLDLKAKLTVLQVSFQWRVILVNSRAFSKLQIPSISSWTNKFNGSGISHRRLGEYCVKVCVSNEISLESVSLSGYKHVIDEKKIILLSTHKIRYLNLSATRISPETIAVLTGNSFALTELNVSDSRANDKVLVAASTLENLNSLDLSSFRTSSFTTEGLNAVFESLHLSILNINGCHMFNDNHLELIIYHSNNLKSLSCSGCFNVTDQGVSRLIRNSEKLEHINVSCCWKLTDVIWVSGNKIGSLKKVEAQLCYQLTDLTVHYLLSYKNTLLVVDLTGCQQISEESKTVIRELGINIH